MNEWFPASRPLPANGLKARSTRGAIGRTWWSGRFVAVLEDIGLGGRLQRGRSYARAGQVLTLTVEPGEVSAVVQGSRSTPYQVRVRIGAFSGAQWAGLEQALAASAWYTAQLLAGEMPGDIEEVFAAHGLPLFPATAADLAMSCSCPDDQVPCKHIAAVFYLLAEVFDQDPFTVLAWRGRRRDDLLAGLRAARDTAPDPASADPASADPASTDLPSTGAASTDPAGPAPAQPEPPVRVVPPLADCIGSYFTTQAAMPPGVMPSTPSTTLLGQLPPVGVTVRDEALADLLRPAYQAFGQWTGVTSGAR